MNCSDHLNSYGGRGIVPSRTATRLGTQRVSDVVARRLVEQIRDGAFADSARLPSARKLATSFGVSLPTVREALRSLEAMGLVTIEHGRGVFLQSSRPLDGVWSAQWMQWLLQHGSPLLDLLEVREAVETKSAELAARHAGPEMLAHLDEILTRGHRLFREHRRGEALLRAYVELDSAFHRAVAAATGNAVLQGLIESLGSALQGSREATVALPGRIARSMEEHRRVVSAIRRRDPEAARLAMQAHVRQVLSEVRSIGRIPARRRRTQ